MLDPWVAEWLASNPLLGSPIEDFSPELLELSRTVSLGAPTVPIACVTDETVGDIPVRIYVDDGQPTGLVVYFHGGGFVMGGIEVMDNVARELAHTSGAAVVSVGYRLAPEHPYPAGLDDCDAVTRWAQANASRFGLPARSVAVAGESAGGNLATAVAIRLHQSGAPRLAAQALLYPVVGGRSTTGSREQFSGLVISEEQTSSFWKAYSKGRDLDHDPYAVPLHADSLTGLPPALIVLGGCDMLRDEGRAYAQRLRERGCRRR